MLLAHGPARAEPPAPHPLVSSLQEEPSETSVTNEWCPVLPDEPVDPDIHTEYRGERVFLCCQKCLKQFRADPAAYVGNLPVLSALTAARDHGEGEADQHAEVDQHDHAEHGDADESEPVGMIRWLGRFHPLVVHFPIALLLMAAAAELLLIFTGASRFAFAARFCLWGGALGALGAAFLGWVGASAVEADYSGFSARLLLFHRWVGVSTALASGVSLFACERLWQTDRNEWRRPYRFTLFLCTLLVTVAGHLGASLIYGWEYLAW